MELSKFEQAYNAFRAERDQLLAQGHAGRWVLYHGGERIGEPCDDRDQLYDIVRERQYAETDFLIQWAVPEPEAIDEHVLWTR